MCASIAQHLPPASPSSCLTTFSSLLRVQLLLNMSCVWTFGRYLEASRLPRPALSMAAIFLLGGWLGSLASANLDAYYVTCGASAGVCALLGGWRGGWGQWRY